MHVRSAALGVLDTLVIDSAWRRHGIGRRLATAIEDWALGAGASWVEVSVYELNPEARQFYDALGYLPLRKILRKPRLSQLSTEGPGQD